MGSIPGLEEKIVEQYALEFKAREFFESAIDTFSQTIKKKKYLEALNQYRLVEVGLAAKGMKSWTALASLFFCGYEEDAAIVLRSLVDVVVEMKFISLDPKERAARFVDFSQIHRMRWLKQGKKHNIIESDERFRKIEADILRDAAPVFERRPKWKEKLPDKWTPENVAQKCEEIGEPMLYLSFMTGSMHMHPNVTTVDDYFVRGRRVRIKAEASVPKDSRAFIEGCLLIYRLLDHLDTVLNLRLASLGQSASEMIQTLAQGGGKVKS